MTETLALPSPPSPGWLDRAAFPFAARWREIEGHRMHLVDEGSGPPVLFVHGTPSWSWEWRHLVAGLRDGHRCVAPDALGFGLSDKPTEGLRLADHSRRLGLLADQLGLEHVHLVVHDFGGPIGLRWAAEHPDRVASITVLNSFLGSPRALPKLWWLGRLLDGAFGRWLYLACNASPRWVAPSAWADRRKLTPAIQRHYMSPFPDAASRHGPWTIVGEITKADPWLAESGRLVAQRLGGHRALLLWGLADPAFGAGALATVRAALPGARWEGLAGVGHFPQEEAPGEVLAALRSHLAG
jgi:haloalkane dehalogenase